MGDYYDRECRPLTMMEWASRIGDRDYKRVAWTEVGAYQVSTVWLGLNHNWNPDGPPLIFETMVFGGGNHDLDMDRYSTLAGALAGHEQTCLLIRATEQSTLPELSDSREEAVDGP